MSEQHDPGRWLDDPALSDALRQDLQAYGGDAPSAERRARMFSGLEAELGLDVAAAEQVVGRAAGKSLGKLKLVLGSMALLVGGMGLLALWPQASAPRAPASVPRPLIVQPAAPEAIEEPSAFVEPTLAPDSVASQRVMQAVPRATRRPRRVRESAPVAPVAPVVVPALPELVDEDSMPRSTLSDPVAELALLAQARRALLSKPAHALEFTEAHASKYPNGTFGEEREVLAIESLLRLGLDDEARQRAHAFEQKFPSSPHRVHLTRIMQDLR